MINIKFCLPHGSHYSNQMTVEITLMFKYIIKRRYLQIMDGIESLTDIENISHFTFVYWPLNRAIASTAFCGQRTFLISRRCGLGKVVDEPRPHSDWLKPWICSLI